MWERIPLTKIAYILLVVILLIIVLGVRFPAKSQDFSLEEWVVVLSERLTSITGSPVESKFLGNTADDPQLRELFATDEDSFVFFRNDSRLELRMGDLLRTEASSAPETTKFALSSVLLRNDIDYGVVALFFGYSVSYVFVPANGSEPVGVLMELSRELLDQAEMITSEGGVF